MQTIRAKLLVPRVTPDLVPRPRLVARLDEGLKRKLTLVAGPAGFGKTTVLGEWLGGTQQPVAWVTLDESDDDIVTFFSYLVAAVCTVYPDCCVETLELLEARSGPPPKLLAATLANDLDALPGPLVLVLDDLQCVTDLAVFEVLDQVIAYLPPGVHLAIGTRTDPPISIATLAARGQLSELREHDLCFSNSEACDFLTRAAGSVVDGSAIAELSEQAEGWAAGLRMLALSARAEASVAEARGRVVRGDAYAMAYLADEVLRKQPPELQHFLRCTSVVERFNEPLGRALAGVGDGLIECGRVIERAVGERLFVTSLGEGWYRYHPLFRQLLLSQLRERLPDDGISELHRRAADWYDRQGMVREALSHAIGAGDTEVAVRIVARHRTDAMNHERWQEIDHWIALFPRLVVEREPVLALTHAWVEHIRMKLLEVEPTVTSFARRLEADGLDLDPEMRRALLGETSTVQGAIAFWSGRFDESRACAAHALDMLPLDSSDVRGVAYVFRTFSEHYAGNPDAALRVLETAWKENSGHTGSFPTRLLVTEFDLAFLPFDLPRMQRILSRMMDLSRHRGLAESADWANYCLGRVAYLRNDLVEARELFEAVAAHRYTTHVYPAYESLLGLALVSAAEGRREDLARHTNVIAEFARESGNAYVRDGARSFGAHLALLEGRTQDALRWADGFERRTPYVPTARCEYAPVTYARTLLAAGTPDRLAEASERLAALEATARSCGARVALVEVLALRARLRDLEGDLEAALGVLEESVLLAADGNPVRVFADLGPEVCRRIASLLVELVRRGRAAEAIAPILAVLPLEGVRLPDTPESLSRRELEVLALLDEGLSNKEIAGQLFVSAKTVEGYTLRIYQKLGVRTRREAVARARALHVLPVG